MSTRGDCSQVTKDLEDVRISDTPRAQSKPIPKSSSIFLKKKLSSISANSSRKQTFEKTGMMVPKKQPFDKNKFFSDSPMAVDDPRWGKQNKLLLGLNQNRQKQPQPTVIQPPSAKPTVGKKGFSRFAKNDSPFTDPYSLLNDKNVERPGAAFLDKPNIYKDEQKAITNLLQNLSEEDEVKEVQSPVWESDRSIEGLSINLLDHQVHGVQFLYEREHISTPFKGGLLCDDMGLGKTVQAIALIVKNAPKKAELDDLNDLNSLLKPRSDIPLRKFKSTLVICPVSLTTQWFQEISKFAPQLKCLIYLGPNRPNDYKKLIGYDVIISSYETIRSEHSKAKSPIYQGYWYRIILDEAHTIKNKKSKIAISVSEIESLRRWCLTGTPIQNSIEDLQSLIYFLRVSKYSNPDQWKHDISLLMKNGSTSKAFELLKKELNQIMIRRTKAILQKTNFKLPPKIVHNVEIEFSKIERNLYDNLKTNIINNLSKNTDIVQSKDTSGSGINDDRTNELFSKFSKIPNKSGSNFYMYALVLLLRLRQMCCHWKLLTDLSVEDVEELNTTTIQPTKIQKESKSIDDELNDLTNFMDSLTVKEKNCEICLLPMKKGSESNKCQKCLKELNSKNIESSKVLKLLEILKSDLNRKTIIFSQFTEMLQILGQTLGKHGIKFVSYNGKMNIKQKDESLNKLRNDQDCTLLLCSLKAGALGLNLTVASQVVIFDPWWNPQIEEQAIDRVYRIGQINKVDIFKFSIKDSVEVEILKLQEYKKNLSKAITDNNLESKNQLMNKLSVNELMKLFGL